MKRISFYSIYTVLLCVLFTSCDVDNYDGPNAKFRGVVIDKTTGKGIQTEQPNGFKIKWTELSWEYQDNIQPEYFWGKTDGSFNWEYAFGYAGSLYEVQPVQGAFVTPEPQQFSLEKGDYPNFTFEVIPFIHIDWEYALEGMELVVKFKATRPEGSTDENFYALSTTRLFISDKTKYVGGMNTGGFINDLSKRIKLNESELGVEQTVRVELESGKKYYMRVGVQTKNPSNAYNYTEVAEITVP